MAMLAGASTFWTAERQEERTDVRMNTSGRASGATEGRARRASSPGEERRGRREIELTIVDGGGPHSGTVIWLPGRGGEPVEVSYSSPQHMQNLSPLPLSPLRNQLQATVLR
eukprot:2206931-Rhodomonas_salina.6